MSENVEEKQQSYNNAAATISEAKAVSDGRAIWELKNWGNPINFNVLKNHANCIVNVTENMSFRFFIRHSERKMNYEGSGMDLEYISLYVYPYITSSAYVRENFELGFTIKVLVDYLNENFQPTATPAGYQSVPETHLSFSKVDISQMVWKNFICFGHPTINKSLYTGGLTQTKPKDYTKRPETLRYGITVELFKCIQSAVVIKKSMESTEVAYKLMPPTDVQPTLNSSSALIDFGSMYEQENNYTDLKIESKDGEVMNAHRFVLAARSIKFRELIEGETKQNDFSGTIKVRDLDAKPLSIILKWIYTGTLSEEFTQDGMEDVIAGTERYELDELYQLCEEKIITFCDIENMLSLFLFAQKHEMRLAMKYILSYIRENIEATVIFSDS